VWSVVGSQTVQIVTRPIFVKNVTGISSFEPMDWLVCPVSQSVLSAQPRTSARPVFCLPIDPTSTARAASPVLQAVETVAWMVSARDARMSSSCPMTA
jgi:hypothetical protein